MAHCVPDALRAALGEAKQRETARDACRLTTASMSAILAVKRQVRRVPVVMPTARSSYTHKPEVVREETASSGAIQGFPTRYSRWVSSSRPDETGPVPASAQARRRHRSPQIPDALGGHLSHRLPPDLANRDSLPMAWVG